MTHLEFKRKYILLYYQTPWKFIEKDSVQLTFSHLNTVASGEPIISTGKNLVIPRGDWVFDFTQFIFDSDGKVIGLDRYEPQYSYSVPRLRVGLSEILRIPREELIFYYGIPRAHVGHIKVVNIPSGVITSHYNTIPIISSDAKIISIGSIVASVIFYSPSADAGSSVDLETMFSVVTQWALLLETSDAVALGSTLLGSFIGIIRPSTSPALDLGAHWLINTHNMFVAALLVNVAKIMAMQPFNVYWRARTRLSVWRPIYISYYDDGTLLSDVQNMDLIEFSYREVI